MFCRPNLPSSIACRLYDRNKYMASKQAGPPSSAAGAAKPPNAAQNGMARPQAKPSSSQPSRSPRETTPKAEPSEQKPSRDKEPSTRGEKESNARDAAAAGKEVKEERNSHRSALKEAAAPRETQEIRVSQPCTLCLLQEGFCLHAQPRSCRHACSRPSGCELVSTLMLALLCSRGNTALPHALQDSARLPRDSSTSRISKEHGARGGREPAERADRAATASEGRHGSAATAKASEGSRRGEDKLAAARAAALLERKQSGNGDAVAKASSERRSSPKADKARHHAEGAAAKESAVNGTGHLAGSKRRATDLPKPTDTRWACSAQLCGCLPSFLQTSARALFCCIGC